MTAEPMQQALDEARAAAALGEIPVGAVVVGPDGAILARAGNRTEQPATPPLTPRSSLSAPLAPAAAAPACQTAIWSSPWNPARCAPTPSACFASAA